MQGKPIIIGIDASRNRSGGAVAHLKGLMSSADPRAFGVSLVHLWAHDDLIDSLSAPTWLRLHRVHASRKSIVHQLFWQYITLPQLVRTLAVDLLFNTDAGTVCPLRNVVTLSQDMLSFEPGEIKRYPLRSRARWRLEALRLVQQRSLRNSVLAIFLTEYARSIIGSTTLLPQSCVIPHGVDESFRVAGANRRPLPDHGPVQCLYISNAAPYKHQWHVIEAVAAVRQASARDIRLRLVGGATGLSAARVRAAMQVYDPNHTFIEVTELTPHSMIAEVLAQADMFIFASSCENLPITLLEAMASGIPICSSNRGPMPEVLGQDAAYFNPEDPGEIASAIELLLRDRTVRLRYQASSVSRSNSYNWSVCAESTWSALAVTARKLQK